MLVFDRKEPIQNFLNTCREKLHIKALAKGAALLEGGEVSRGHVIDVQGARFALFALLANKVHAEFCVVSEARHL